MENHFRTIIRQKIVDSLAALVPKLTPRDVWLPSVPGKAIAVIGMRRAGKTSLLWRILDDRLSRGTPREGLLYFSFEDERLAGLEGKDLDLLGEEYYRLHPHMRGGPKAVFLLDEIQVVPGWEVFVRRLLDTERLDLFISGSSARLLSREVATSMRGRAMEAIVQPFSFRESLRHAGQEPGRSPEHLTKGEKSLLDHALRVYLIQGGFPEAQGVDVRNRSELLRGYVDLVLLRDVIERNAVTHPLALRWLVRQLLGNAAGMFSINKFHADLKSQGMAVGKDTLHSYLAALEDAFLLQTVTIDADSERRRRVNPRKVYPVDPGLIPLFDRSGRSNIGHALETVVFLELRRRGAQISYVRTTGGFEVDFLVRGPDGSENLVQVCADLDAPDTFRREIRALEDAAVSYPHADKILITIDKPSTQMSPEDVRVVEARDWLLEEFSG